MSSSVDELEIVSRFLASSDPGAAFREVASWLKQKAELGAWDDLAEVLPRLALPNLDYTSAMSLHRILRQVADQPRGRGRAVKVAILGSFTTHQLVTLLDLYLRAGRVEPEIYEADYGTFRQELLDPTAAL